MRKQTKWAVVLGAAAVMTFGACMTSFAATGFVEEDGAWYYYDSDGEAVTDTWKKAADGLYYYLGDDGEMAVDAWVESDTNYYYVDSWGARVINQWRFMYPADDDSDDDESWFWFGSNGKMVTAKTTVNGKVYYFDENGKMLTGWIEMDSDGKAASIIEEGSSFASIGDVRYCKEDGTRATGGWQLLYEPGDEDEEDLYWYYFNSSGKPHNGAKKTVSGKSYIFDTDAKMLSGWVTKVGTADNYTAVEEDDEYPLMADTYYCGSSADGAVKKGMWVKTPDPNVDQDDSDADFYWFYLAKNGTPYYAGGSDVTSMGEADKIPSDYIGTFRHDAHYAAVGIKKIGTKYYMFRDNGRMVNGLIELDTGSTDYAPGLYYFGGGNDGALKTGSVSINDEDGTSFSYYFATATASGGTSKEAVSKGQGVTGIYSSKLYKDGLAITAEEDMTYQVVAIEAEYVTDGIAYYLVNENGKVMTGNKKDANSVTYYVVESGVTITKGKDGLPAEVTSSFNEWYRAIKGNKLY